MRVALVLVLVLINTVFAGVGSDAAHVAAQNHLATLSTNSVHRTIDGATHEALIADEADAAATTQAILDVVSSVRTHQPLPPS